MFIFIFLPAEDGIRAGHVTGVQTCALPIYGDGTPLSGLQEGDFGIILVSTMDQDVQAVASPVSEVQTAGIYTFSITSTNPESFEAVVIVGGVALDDTPEITFEPASQEPEFRPFIRSEERRVG